MASTLPVKAIPGSYGIPLISPIADRLDFYYNQGQDKFFESRVAKYNSTVYRVNVAPGPFMASNPGVIALLDAKSFPILFDVSKVEKRNVFVGNYMPSTQLTGGYRVCAYLDPSEPDHARIKQLLFNLLISRRDYVIPAFRSCFSALFDTMETQLAASPGATSDFNKLNDDTSLDFLGEAYFGARLTEWPALGAKASAKVAKWIIFSLAPIMTLGLPKILEEIFLHTLPLPPFLAKGDYDDLYSFFNSNAASVLDESEKLGLSREEVCHNLLFTTLFNSYGGMKVLFPGIMAWVSKAGPDFHARLAKEIRAAVAAEGGKVTMAAVSKMELVGSAVYEALRMDPPVKFQYATAKQDLIVESHDAAYQIKKGETLFGYQPLATKDEKVFVNGGEYVGDRFVGEGKNLLKYVLWSNGPETESPTVGNKQCAGKDFVGLVGRLLLVELFLRYDTFTADVGINLLGNQTTVTSLTPAKSLAPATS